MITNIKFERLYRNRTDPIVDLQPLACCDCEFESRQRHGGLSVVTVVRCQSSLRLADHSSRGVLPSVACLSVKMKT